MFFNVFLEAQPTSMGESTRTHALPIEAEGHWQWVFNDGRLRGWIEGATTIYTWAVLAHKADITAGAPSILMRLDL